MAIELEVGIDTVRPPAEVFAQLAAVERWPEWLIASGIVSVARSDGAPAGAPLAAGSTLRIEQHVAGRSATLDARVTACAPPTHFAVEGRDADGITVAIDARLTDRAPGTHLVWSLRIGLPFRLRIFESMARPQVERAARLDLEAFRRRLDAVAAD